MADDRPTLTVPPKRKASFLNIHSVTGLAVGSLFASAVPFAAPLGLVAGSWLGKRKMQREEQFGKQVSPPSSWNLGTFFGGMGGFNVGVVGALTAVAIFGTGGLAGIAALGGLAASTAIGGWVGGKIGKQFQKREYNAAEQHVMLHGEFVPPAQQQAQSPQQAQGMGQAPQQPQQGANMAQATQQMNPEQLAQLQAIAAQGQRMAPPQAESMADKVGHSKPLGPQQR